MKKENNGKGASVQALIGVKAFSEYGVMTSRGEMLFFYVTPSNISVLSASAIENKTRQLALVLSAFPDLGILCVDSSECFEGNRAYLSRRCEKERNPKVKQLLRKDLKFLSEIQLEMSTSRQFMFFMKCRNMNPMQVFNYANTIQKTLSEQGFDSHLMTKGEVKRFMALYFGASIQGERLPDVDGAQYFDGKKEDENDG